MSLQCQQLNLFESDADSAAVEGALDQLVRVERGDGWVVVSTTLRMLIVVQQTGAVMLAGRAATTHRRISRTFSAMESALLGGPCEPVSIGDLTAPDLSGWGGARSLLDNSAVAREVDQLFGATNASSPASSNRRREFECEFGKRLLARVGSEAKHALEFLEIPLSDNADIRSQTLVRQRAEALEGPLGLRRVADAIAQAPSLAPLLAEPQCLDIGAAIARGQSIYEAWHRKAWPRWWLRAMLRDRGATSLLRGSTAVQILDSLADPRLATLVGSEAIALGLYIELQSVKRSELVGRDEVLAWASSDAANLLDVVRRLRCLLSLNEQRMDLRAVLRQPWPQAELALRLLRGRQYRSYLERAEWQALQGRQLALAQSKTHRLQGQWCSATGEELVQHAVANKHCTSNAATLAPYTMRLAYLLVHPSGGQAAVEREEDGTWHVFETSGSIRAPLDINAAALLEAVVRRWPPEEPEGSPSPWEVIHAARCTFIREHAPWLESWLSP